MPKIQFSDVTPPERRSIRDIPIPNGGKRKVPIIIRPEKTQTPQIEPAVPDFNSNFDSKISEITEKKNSGPYEYYYPKDKNEPASPNNFSPKSKRKTYIFGTIIAILVAGFIISMMTVFASATVTIKPKTQNIDTDAKITGISGEASAGSVRYEVIKLSESKTVSVPATSEQAVELKASGKIMVYNDFSTDPQRLIVRTRFETPDGLIFRIPESIIVPGKTVKNGADTPGSVETQIIADEAGDKYNIKKTDFTVPGFSNDASRFKGFYGRSTTDITGGFVGNQKTVLPADEQTALQSIDVEAQTSLGKSLQSKVPDGLVLLPGAITYSSQELPQKEDGSSVILGKEVTTYAVLLNKQDLSDQIVAEYIASSSDWNNIKSSVKDFSLLKVVSLPDNLETGNQISLQIQGTAPVSADIDANLISQKLSGAPKGDASKLMNEFPGIESMTATIRPIWKQSFPNNPSKIYVKIAS